MKYYVIDCFIILYLQITPIFLWHVKGCLQFDFYILIVIHSSEGRFAIKPLVDVIVLWRVILKFYVEFFIANILDL
jgi:hypothetical protein